MWIRAWIKNLLPLLALTLFCLINPGIARAKDRLDIEINEIHYNGDAFTLVKIDVDPARLAGKVFSSRLERIKVIQSEQDRFAHIEHILNRTQDYIADNYRVRGRTTDEGELNDYAYGTAYKFPDPTGVQKLLESHGMARPKMKIDDYLSRRSLTLILCKGRSLTDPIATIKVVQTDFDRVNKDFADRVPPQGLRAVNDQANSQSEHLIQFEVENLSIGRERISGKRYDYIPFLIDQIHQSGIIQEPLDQGKEVLVKLNALEGPLALYEGMGFDVYNVARSRPEEPLVYYMSTPGQNFFSNLNQFFAVETIEQYWQLPWIAKKVAEGQSDLSKTSLSKTTLFVKSQLGMPKFRPKVELESEMDLDCSLAYHQQN